MAISAYPFFDKVAELTGRLTAIQGDCASVEIHRRMAETYGAGRRPTAASRMTGVDHTISPTKILNESADSLSEWSFQRRNPAGDFTTRTSCFWTVDWSGCADGRERNILLKL